MDDEEVRTEWEHLNAELAALRDVAETRLSLMEALQKENKTLLHYKQEVTDLRELSWRHYNRAETCEAEIKRLQKESTDKDECFSLLCAKLKIDE